MTDSGSSNNLNLNVCATCLKPFDDMQWNIDATTRNYTYKQWKTINGIDCYVDEHIIGSGLRCGHSCCGYDENGIFNTDECKICKLNTQ